MKISLEQHLRDYAASFYNGQPENDRNIRLKIDHTFRVRDEARRIAAAELPDPAERSLAERAALLHDLSRFEQFARFGTFMDAASFDHGDRSAELAAEQHLLDDLDELLLAYLAHRALVGCLGTFVNVTAYGTTPFLCHNLLLFNVCDCILFVVQR